MKSAVETVDETRVKLTVEVGVEELKPSVDQAYTQIAQQVTIPGFRKGKVPPRIIDQRVGRAAVMEQAINDAMPALYGQAVQEADVKPLGQPSIDVTSIPGVTEGAEDLVFTAEIDVRPDVALPELSELTVTVADVEVTDADVDERMTTMRQQYASLVGVDRAAADGDFVTIDLSARIGEEEIDSVTGVSYQIGSGNMLEGLDEALTGLSAGETTTFAAPLAGGEHAGEEAQVTVTPTAVKEQDLPEVDDDFAQMASEFDTIAELTENVRTQVADAKQNNRAVEARDQLLEQLLERTEFPVPSGVVEAEVHRHLENENRLEDEEHRAEVQVEAKAALRRQLLLDALAEKLEVQVAQNELVEFLVRTAQQYQMDPNEFISSASANNQLPVYVSELARNKSLAVALREVAVVDGNGETVDLTPYIGSDDEDAAEAAAAAEAQTAAASDVELVDVETPETRSADGESADVVDAEVESSKDAESTGR